VLREEPTPGPGFLILKRWEIVTELAGRKSRSVTYDAVERKHPDAVVVVPHYVENGRKHVVFRSCIRPPIALRGEGFDGNLWELPAGLIEGGEDPAAAGARELLEEIGAGVPPSALQALGSITFPCAGALAERNHFFHVVVDPSTFVTPEGDQSPLEENGAVLGLPLEDALAAMRAGRFPDAKTEIGLRRFAELPFSHPPHGPLRGP